MSLIYTAMLIIHYKHYYIHTHTKYIMTSIEMGIPVSHSTSLDCMAIF